MTVSWSATARFWEVPLAPARLRRWFYRGAAVLAGVALGLAVLELGLRLAGYSSPPFYIADQARGYALRPGAEGPYTAEGGSYVRINSQGMRDREHALKKPAGVVRVAVLGDSYAEAMQVPQEKTFWAVLEDELRRAGQDVEVLNFGTSSYSTAQELITLRTVVWDYEPDLVILAFCSSNDVSDNSRVLKGKDVIPYFRLDKGRLVLDDSFLGAPAFQVSRAWPSRTISWLSQYLRVMQAARGAYQRMRLPRDQVEERNKVYCEPVDPAWKEAWQVTEELIKTMNREVLAHQARFLLVTLSNDIQVHPEDAVRQAFMKRMGVGDLFYPESRLRSLSEREQIAALWLAPLMQQYAREHRVRLHGFDERAVGHWNVKGHALAGRLLAQTARNSMGVVKP